MTSQPVKLHPAAAETLEQRAILEIIDVGRYLDARGLLPAWSGNLSARIDARTVAITRSHIDKGELTEDDVIVVHLDRPAPSGASAETDLHLSRYRESPEVGSVLHIHSVASTILSQRWLEAAEVVFRGYEIQKVLDGVTTHESEVWLPIFANSQDVAALAEEVSKGLATRSQSRGFLLGGHGLYAWGPSLRDARANVVALEFLLNCELEKLRIGPS